MLTAQTEVIRRIHDSEDFSEVGHDVDLEKAYVKVADIFGVDDFNMTKQVAAKLGQALIDASEE